MPTITVIGAGMMGTALCWPLVDNHHTIRLVGTPLDDEIITSLRSDRFHPTLKRPIPTEIQPFSHTELAAALQGADYIASGVSSFGVEWFAHTVGPYLRPDLPVIAVTKGLHAREDGSLIPLPELTESLLPAALQGRVSLNAIGGPCIAHELAARRHTCVAFCGKDAAILARLKALFATPYYHISTSTDLIGVETCAALKNGYAMGVSLAVGMMEKAGPDGLANMYNPQAALFGQACREMRLLVGALGGKTEEASWLPRGGRSLCHRFRRPYPPVGQSAGSRIFFSRSSPEIKRCNPGKCGNHSPPGAGFAKIGAARPVKNSRFPPDPLPGRSVAAKSNG